MLLIHARLLPASALANVSLTRRRRVYDLLCHLWAFRAISQYFLTKLQLNIGTSLDHNRWAPNAQTYYYTSML